MIRDVRTLIIAAMYLWILGPHSQGFAQNVNMVSESEFNLPIHSVSDSAQKELSDSHKYISVCNREEEKIRCLSELSSGLNLNSRFSASLSDQDNQEKSELDIDKIEKLNLTAPETEELAPEAVKQKFPRIWA